MIGSERMQKYDNWVSETESITIKNCVVYTNSDINDPSQLIWKGLSVINSCKSNDQLDVAKKYCRLLITKTKFHGLGFAWGASLEFEKAVSEKRLQCE